MAPTKKEMKKFYFGNPIQGKVIREILGTRIEYYFLENDLSLKTKPRTVLIGCILSGGLLLIHKKKEHKINQFDFFLLPPNSECQIKINPENDNKNKLCIFYSSLDQEGDYVFEIQRYAPDKFIPRGDHGSNEKMATYRTVWTAFKNELFMSGFTNIPSESLRSGVITSVNLEKNESGNIEIYSHVHPQYPEVYIMCIDDDKYAITQYLINEEGFSVCRDLSNGDGVFFPGSLGHSNFARPTYRKLNYAMYMWIIPTFGRKSGVNPVTLKI
ncbi:MAG: hypothetical protein ACFFB1_10195 [Promethearchaeota archaeon]